METIDMRRNHGIATSVGTRRRGWRWRHQLNDRETSAITAGTPTRSGAPIDGLDRAAAAQTRWWLGVLGRVDAAMEEDISAMSATARFDAVSQAWEAQRQAMPEYPALAAFGGGDPKQQGAGRRYARILALFAGTAAVTDDEEAVTAAGLALARKLGESHTGAHREDETFSA